MYNKYLRQISILGTNTKKSVKLKVQLVCQFLSWFYNSAFIFSDFLLIGTSNRDLFQILFGQKLPKTAIVHKADQTRATASLQVQSVNAGAARLNFSLPLSSEHRLTFLVCMATWLIKLVPIWYIFQLFFSCETSRSMSTTRNNFLEKTKPVFMLLNKSTITWHSRGKKSIQDFISQYIVHRRHSAPPTSLIQLGHLRQLQARTHTTCPRTRPCTYGPILYLI